MQAAAGKIPREYTGTNTHGCVLKNQYVGQQTEVAFQLFPSSLNHPAFHLHLYPPPTISSVPL